MEKTLTARVFMFNSKELPDPNPEMSPEKVKEIFANEHPELVTANIQGPVYKNDKAVYTFSTSFKPKG